MKKEIQLLTIYRNQKKIKWLIISLLLSALLFLQCGEQSSKEKENNNDKKGVKIGNIDKYGIFLNVGGKKKIYLGQPIAEVKKIMGEPLKEELWLKFSNVENNIYRIYYKGLRILYDVGNKKVESIIIKSIYCFLDVCVGDSLDILKQKLKGYKIAHMDKSFLYISLPYNDKYKYKVEADLGTLEIGFGVSKDNKVEYIDLRSDYPGI